MNLISKKENIMSASVRRPRGQPRKYFTDDEKKRGRLQASLKFSKTEGGKNARSRYRVKQRDKLRKAKMLKYFSDNHTLYKETLKEVIQNEQLFNILKELIAGETHENM